MAIKTTQTHNKSKKTHKNVRLVTIKAFLFDLDGTLIDAFPAYEKAFKHTIESTGRTYKKGSLETYYGQLDIEILRQLLKKDKIDKETEHLIEQKRSYYLTIAQTAIKPLSCAAELIHLLKERNIKTAIATSGQRSATEIAIDKLKIRHLLDATITATEVKKGKPDPELFLKASELINIPPNDCIVIEDSTHGIEAAKRADMKTIAVSTGKTSMRDLKNLNPDYAVDSLCEIIPKLDNIINAP